MNTIRTNSANSDFETLCSQLNKDLHERYGKAQSKYDKNNIIEENNTIIVGYLKDAPIACGCFKQLNTESVEIKRMYVMPSQRRKGFSSRILLELEKWAKELGYRTAILETGKGQPEAIGLYQKSGYKMTENYGPYIGVENSVCMTKKL